MRRLAAPLIACLALAGCGGGGDDGDGTQTASPARLAPTSATGPTGAKGQPQNASVDGVLRDEDSVRTLYLLVTTAKLVPTLSEPGPYTVFAPTSTTFTKLGVERLSQLLQAPDLRSRVLAHVVAGRVELDRLKDGQQLRTLAGTTLDVSVDGDRVSVGGARVQTTPLYAGNGVVFRIDRVLSAPGS